MAASADPALPSSVSFPASESPPQAAVQLQPPPLIRPFRRISMPSYPSALYRNSIISVSSFDSLAEEFRPGVAISSSNPNLRHAKPALTNTGRSRPLFIESPKRLSARRSTHTKPVNDAKALKRKQIIDEFYATEKSFVNGLDLIYSHFLTPLITSLETSTPLLDRASLTNLFSNFVDIWNLHQSFLSALTEHLGEHSSAASPPLASLLLSHFPYLSLHNPFITAYPSMISTLFDLTTPSSQHRPNAHYNHAFAAFISTQELDPRCGKLKLRDWLLTIVQRCPRYLLLIKDLIKYTEEEDAEHKKLESALALVKKITSTFDTSLQIHAQILSLLTLQRSTTGLPFQLIEPGRTLLKRGSLLQIECKSAPREREFLLFSDCFIWLANEETESTWSLGWSASAANDSTPSSPVRPTQIPRKSGHERGTGSSDTIDTVEGSLTVHEEEQARAPPPLRKSMHQPPPRPRRIASTGEERWVFKGQVSLVDIEATLVSSRETGDERRFEVHSPEGSFVLYASSEDERESWVSEIRQAKVQRLASLNMTNPNSTLTSSSSTNHVRRSLQALPFPPSDNRIATIRVVQSVNDITELRNHDHEKTNGRGEGAKPSERRKKVDHWVPPIWIPDEKTEACMRCGKSFGWRRRRHHCRLCGRCVCAACSGRTFFIADHKAQERSSKPARSCEVCYETVFPLVDPPPGSANSANSSSFISSSFLSSSSSVLSQPSSNDTISSLSKLPSWLSMPALPSSSSQPQALMFDMDLNGDQGDTPDAATTSTGTDIGATNMEGREFEEGRRGRIRRKPLSRPRSYHQILEDFQDFQPGRHHISPFAPLHLIIDCTIEERSESAASEGVDGKANSHNDGVVSSPLPSTPLPTMNNLSQTPTPSPRRRKEDTARRSKRFSLPAVALQTANVTTRTTSVSSVPGRGSGGNGNDGKNGNGGVSVGNESERKTNETGAMGRLRRLSLVPGVRN